MLVSTGVVCAVEKYPSRCASVTGSYSTEGVSKEFARKMAIRNALKNASMRSNLKVSSSLEVSNFSLVKDATRFTSQSKVSKFQITEEGMKKLSYDEQFDQSGMPLKDVKSKLYQVTMDVCLTEDPGVCENVLGNYLQPKMAIAQVLLADGYGARDISNLRSGYQVELERRLRHKNYQNTVLIHSGTHLQDGEQVLSPNLSMEVLEPIRSSTGAQYLLLNVIRSVARFNEGSSLFSDVKRFYNQEVVSDARYLETETFIVDMLSRQVVYQKRHGFDIKGDVTVGRDRAFGTNAFFATNTGMVFATMLEQVTTGISQFLKCKPLKTNIIDIRGKEYILFLSTESGAGVGDELTVYHKFGRSVTRAGVDLGFDAKPSGFLKIIRINSKFAVAEVMNKTGLIQVGDEVSSW